MKTYGEFMNHLLLIEKDDSYVLEAGNDATKKFAEYLEKAPTELELKIEKSIFMTGEILSEQRSRLSRQFFACLFDLAYQKQRADHFEALCKSKDIIDDVITRAQSK